MGECVRDGVGKSQRLCEICQAEEPPWAPLGCQRGRFDTAHTAMWARREIGERPGVCQLLALPVSMAFTAVNQDQG